MSRNSFVCSKCGFSTGSLVSLEWHVTSPECPHFDEKVKKKRNYCGIKKYLGLLVIGLMVSFLFTFIFWGIGTLLYGFGVFSIEQTFVCFLVITLLVIIASGD